ncbi:MAG: AMP-binding protein [Pseudomonadota bacterium]
MSQEYSVLTDYIDARATHAANQAAYHTWQQHEWQTTSWGQFANRARRLANGLDALGVEENDVVVLLLPTGLTWELAQVALLLQGATVVGLDAHDLPERLAQIVETCGARGAIVDSAVSMARIPQEVWTQFDFVVSTANDAKPENFAKQWLAFDDISSTDEKNFATRATPQTVATIIFTSGSTGRPKGIPYTHEQVCGAISAILEAFPEIEAGDRLVCWLPLSNLFQRMINYCAAGRGAETYFVSDPRRIMEMLPLVKPHLFISVPRFFEKLNDGIEANLAKSSALQRSIANWAIAVGERSSARRRDGQSLNWFQRLQLALADRLVLSRLRQVMGGEIKFLVSGSAPISMWLLERFHGMGMLILEAYGLSENVTPIAVNRVKDFHFGRVGRPMAGNEVSIAEDGEVLVKGPGVFGGYLGAPTSEAGVGESGFLHTGDLGEFDENGFLRLVGRKSEIFKTSTGRKVAPVPIEAKIKRLAGVDFAVLIGSGRKMTSVIVAPGMEDERDLKDESAFTSFVKRLRAEITPALEDEQSYAQPMGAIVRNKTFTIDTEELTSNLKIRRKVIEEKNQAALVALYDMLENGSNEQLLRFDDHTILITL